MKKLLFLLLFFLIVSCSETLKFSGKSYRYNSKHRSLSLNFINDSICQLRNTFRCTDIDSVLRETVITCKYRTNNDSIFLRNVNCINGDCVYEPFLKFASQYSKKCSFLNTDSRDYRIFAGPSLLSDYRRYGMVPNIDIDTLFINKNKITLIKGEEGFSTLYFLKKRR